MACNAPNVDLAILPDANYFLERNAQMFLLLIEFFVCRPYLLFKVCTIFIIHEAVLIKPLLKVGVLQEIFLISNIVCDTPNIDLAILPDANYFLLRNAQMFLLLIEFFVCRPYFVQLFA